MSDNFHLHIGLGRIGLGLVLGLLNPNLKVVIAQRCSEEWKNISNKDKSVVKLKLSNNVGYNKYVNVKYIDNDKHKINIDKIINGLNTCPLLIIYDDKDKFKVLDTLIPHIFSISTSLKKVEAQMDFVTWLNNNSHLTSHLKVFQFENVIIPELLNINSENNTSIKLIRTIPDRVCPYINRKNNTNIHIDVDEYYHVVIDAPFEECEYIISNIDMDKILFAKSSEVYDFYHNRKRRLVNSIHYFLALLSYNSLRHRNIPKKNWSTQYMPYLLSSILNPHSWERKLINTLIMAQAIRCVLDTRDFTNNPNIIEQIFNGCNETQLFSKLIEYSTDFLDRLNNQTDLVNRVLDFEETSILNMKHDEHINELSKFISYNEKPIDEFSSHYRPWRQDIRKALTEIEKIEREMLADKNLSDSCPGYISSINAEQNDDGYVSLTWQAPQNGGDAEFYIIQQRVELINEEVDWIYIGLAFQTKYTHNIKVVDKMHFRVIPANYKGDGGPSKIVTLTPNKK